MTTDYHHSFDGGEVIYTNPEQRSGFTLGNCPLTGEQFQFAYTDRTRPGTANACFNCGDIEHQTVGELLSSLNRERAS